MRLRQLVDRSAAGGATSRSAEPPPPPVVPQQAPADRPLQRPFINVMAAGHVIGAYGRGVVRRVHCSGTSDVSTAPAVGAALLQGQGL